MFLFQYDSLRKHGKNEQTIAKYIMKYDELLKG